MSKVLILGPTNYERPFAPHFKRITHDPDELADCTAVVFTGGSDVDPRLYNQNHHPFTMSNMERDIKEKGIYQSAKKLKLPMFGICRGAQFLCVMNGGTLIQHIEGHSIAGTHQMYIHDVSGGIRNIPVTSTHHQMMHIAHGRGTLLGYSDKLSNVYEDGDGPLRKAIAYDTEMVVWTKTRSLAVQFHPEYMPATSEAWKLYQKLIPAHASGRLFEAISYF